MSRGSLASYRHFLSDLLLTDDELLNPGWEPSVSLEVFFQLRLRPAVYFLQRCLCDERGVSGPAPRIPAAEKAELKDWLFRLLGTIRLLGRAKLVLSFIHGRLSALGRGTPASRVVSSTKYKVPGVAANMFALTMMLVPRLVEDCPRDNGVMYITQPALLCFYHEAVSSNGDGTLAREYEPFHKDGTLRESFSEQSLAPNSVQ
ncbi:hypothetical protein C8R47DRAFT_1206186 [Mycena vitilis]|nr:hypothetical protein C8R47DRAFT_1206186 [Mycena vitilis]